MELVLVGKEHIMKNCFFDCRRFTIILFGASVCSGCVDLDYLIQTGKAHIQLPGHPFFAGNKINSYVLSELSAKRFSLIETISNSGEKEDGRQVLIVSEPSRKVVINVPDCRERASMVPVSPFSTTVLDKDHEWTWIEYDPDDRSDFSTCKWLDGSLSDQSENETSIIINLKEVLSANPKIAFYYVGNEFDWLEISLAKTSEEWRSTLNCLANGRVFVRFSGEDWEAFLTTLPSLDE